MDERFIDYRLNFLGYGDPQSRLWFVGIEEGGSLDSNLQIHDHPKIPGTNYMHDPELPIESARVWDRYRDIATHVGAGSAYFMSNMAPFARPQEHISLGSMNESQYRDLVIHQRIPALRQLIDRFQPRAVLFHGKGAWQRYQVRELFGLTPKTGRVQDYPVRRLVFTNFLTRGFNKTDQEVVEALLRDWLSH
jgi:hypothetical protein